MRTLVAVRAEAANRQTSRSTTAPRSSSVERSRRGPPSVRIVTNSFTAAGGDNYPTFEDAFGSDRVNLGLGYEQALLAYILSFPEMLGLPTIPGQSPAGAPGKGPRELV